MAAKNAVDRIEKERSQRIATKVPCILDKIYRHAEHLALGITTNHPLEITHARHHGHGFMDAMALRRGIGFNLDAPLGEHVMDQDGDWPSGDKFCQKEIDRHALGIDALEQVDLGFLFLRQPIEHLRHDPAQPALLMDGPAGLPVEDPLTAVVALIDQNETAVALLKSFVERLNGARIGTMLVAIVHQ